MIAAIVYNSQTGSCKRYADELSRQLHIPAYALGSAPTRADGELIFVTWIMAGSIVGWKKAKKAGSIAAVVAVGMAPASEKTAESIRAKCAIPSQKPVFVLQGGFNINKLPAPMKLIMKLKTKDIAKQLEAKKEKNELSAQEKALLKMARTGVGEPADWNAAPVVEWVLSKYKSEGALRQKD